MDFQIILRISRKYQMFAGNTKGFHGMPDFSRECQGFKKDQRITTLPPCSFWHIISHCFQKLFLYLTLTAASIISGLVDCIVQCAVCGTQCAGCSVQYSVCSKKCVLCSEQGAVCSEKHILTFFTKSE